ncbi:hypothetical protein [Streptomyces nodosus]|uniref:hypothetical protein n=1 Tax=Streptomyces nodosus TaxID=40318 RepID=UPI00130E0442|nr:hypothetical protein [Streptomyces nodosus]MBB4794949.1 hypothetical protein [Streptomyces nodosus]
MARAVVARAVVVASRGSYGAHPSLVPGMPDAPRPAIRVAGPPGLLSAVRAP